MPHNWKFLHAALLPLSLSFHFPPVALTLVSAFPFYQVLILHQKRAPHTVIHWQPPWLVLRLLIGIHSSQNNLRHPWWDAWRQKKATYTSEALSHKRAFIKRLLLSSQEYSWLLCTALTYKNKRKTICNIVFHLLVIIFFSETNDWRSLLFQTNLQSFQ